jgi:hypothetical protein
VDRARFAVIFWPDVKSCSFPRRSWCLLPIGPTLLPSRGNMRYMATSNFIAVPFNDQRHAVSLEIVTIYNQASISVLLRKCLVLAHQLKNDRLRSWVENELNGYATSDAELPEYRRIYTPVA